MPHAVICIFKLQSASGVFATDKRDMFSLVKVFSISPLGKVIPVSRATNGTLQSNALFVMAVDL